MQRWSQICSWSSLLRRCFVQFVSEAEQCADVLAQEEDLLGEIPDEFCDPFTGAKPSAHAVVVDLI